MFTFEENIYCVKRKEASFDWGGEQEQCLQSIHTSLNSGVLGYYNPADLLVLKESITERILHEASFKYYW